MSGRPCEHNRAAIIVLEELEHARARGAHIYGEVGGFASRCNAYHMTGLNPEGKEMSGAIDAGIRGDWFARDRRLPAAAAGGIDPARREPA